MTILEKHDRDITVLRRRAWAFVAGAIIAALAVTIALAARQGFFKQTTPLYFVADSAADILRGMPVKVLGLRIGSVGEVVLQADATVKVRMDIDEEYMRFITHDAVVQLRKEGFVGGGTIEIEPSTHKDQLAIPQAILKFEREATLTELAQQLHDEILPIIQDIKEVTGALADPKTGVKQSLALVNGTVGSLKQSSDELKTLLQHGDAHVATITQKTSAVLDAAERDMAQLGRSLQSVETKLPVLLDKVDGILEDAGKLTHETASQAPALLRSGGAALNDTREMIDGIKTSWPVNKMLAPAPSAPLAPDSYVPAN